MFQLVHAAASAQTAAEVLADRQADLDAACPDAPTIQVDFAGIEAIWPSMTLFPVVSRLDRALEGLQQLCLADGFEADYPGYFDATRAAVAQIDTLAIVPHPEGAALTDDTPGWTLDGTTWSIGIGEPTNETLDVIHLRWLLFESGLEVDGVPVAERRMHGEVDRRLAESEAAVEAACAIDLTVEWDPTEWTGSAFTYPWEDARSDAITLGFDPLVMANFAGSFTGGLETNCATNGQLGTPLSRITLRPDPIAATHHDPAVFDPQLDSTPEERAFWTLEDGHLTLFLWGGTVSLTEEAQDWFDAGNGPSRCTRTDPAPPECGGTATPEPTDGDPPAGEGGCTTSPAVLWGWTPLVLLVLRRR